MRALTQEELLAEAAETELRNTASLARLIAVEEEARAPLRACSAGRGVLFGVLHASAVCHHFLPLHLTPLRTTASARSIEGL